MKPSTTFFLITMTCIVCVGCVPPHVEPAKTIDGLIEQLSSSYYGERGIAAEALGERGPDAGKAVPALIKLLDDEQQDVRYAAASALGKIGDESAKPALMKKLSDYERYEFTAVAGALIDIGLTESESTKAIKLLRSALRKSKHHKGVAAECLGGLGPAASDAVPDLIKVLQRLDDEDNRTRRSVLAALGRIGAKCAVPHLAKFLDPEDQCYIAASIGIGEIMHINPGEVKDWWEKEGKFMDWEKQDENPELPESSPEEKPEKEEAADE